MNNEARVIKIGAERVYQLRPYESVRLSVEVETPDLSLSDDIGIRGVYLECVQRLDNAFAEIYNKYNQQTQNR